MAEENSQLSNVGMVMLFLGILLDIASIICVILILAFGVGLLLAKIVYAIGLIIIGGWTLSRTGMSSMKGGLKEKMSGGLTKIFKKHGKRLAVKIIPGFGDAIPLWTWTVYTELTGKSLPIFPNLKKLF